MVYTSPKDIDFLSGLKNKLQQGSCFTFTDPKIVVKSLFPILYFLYA